MKKTLAILLAAVMLLGILSACGQTADTVETEAPSEAPMETDSAVSEAPSAWVPTGNVEIITPGTPGGDQDLAARQYAEYLSDYWGVNVVVTNISGDAAAMLTIHDAEPDGNTILYHTDAFLLNVAQNAVDFGMDDVQVAAVTAQLDGQVLVARSELGWTSLDDLKAACDAEPDKYIVSIAYSKTTQIMGEMLVDAGIQCRLADSDGGSDRIAKLLGDFVDAAFLTYDAAKDYIDSGEFTALAIVQDERSAVCPDVPTAVEQGYDVVFPTTHFTVLPKDTPAEVVEGWQTALAAVNEEPDFGTQMSETVLGLVAKYESGEDAMPYLNSILEYAQNMG